MKREEMAPSDGFHFVFVTDDGPIHSDEMLPCELLFVIEDLLNERDSLRDERKSLTRQMFDIFRRRR